MERLTVKINGTYEIKGIEDIPCGDVCERNHGCETCKIHKAVEKLAAYEEAEERRINPGDTVYVMDEEMNLILRKHMNRQEAREMLAMHKCPFYGCKADECDGPECVDKFFDMYEQTEEYKFAEQNKEFFEECVKTAGKYEIKDSGNRTEFGTGAVRDIQEDKGRCDLLPLNVVAGLYEQTPPSAILYLIADFMESGYSEMLYRTLREFAYMKEISISNMLLDVSMHYKQGAEKYGERNWEKGIPLHSYIDSGVRHFLKHIDGQTDERHDLAFIWNLLGAVWTMEHKPEMIDIPFEMLGGRDA